MESSEFYDRLSHREQFAGKQVCTDLHTAELWCVLSPRKDERQYASSLIVPRI